jgi:hypothetical protein
MKLYERYVTIRFVKNVTTTLSNEQISKIKVVDLDDFDNFYVHDFFSCNHLMFHTNYYI